MKHALQTDTVVKSRLSQYRARLTTVERRLGDRPAAAIGLRVLLDEAFE